jgi:hypothetical protein
MIFEHTLNQQVHLTITSYIPYNQRNSFVVHKHMLSFRLYLNLLEQQINYQF